MSSYAGTFAAGELTVELVPDGPELRGDIVLDGERWPLHAAPVIGGLAGRFTVEGADFAFRARLEGNFLHLESGGVEHVLERRAAAPRVNPLAALRPVRPAGWPSAPARPAPAPAPAPPAPVGQVYRHPTGAQFHIPPSWTAQPAQGGVQLIPPQAGFGPTGPTEMYLVSGEAAPGIASAGDPRVLQYFDHSLPQLIPGAARSAAPETAGHGLRLVYEAANPMTGGKLRILALVTVIHDKAIAVIGIADPAALERRRPALDTVFSSIAWGEGDRDAALVGIWHQRSYSSSGGGTGQGSHSAETRRIIQLAADGSARMRSSTETSASMKGRDSYGDPSWTASTYGQGGDEKSGTWNAAGSMLYLLWSDGATASLQYKISGAPGARRVTLLGGDKPVEWTERPT